MSTPTSNPDDLTSLMDPYSSLLSTLSYFDIDGSILDQHDQSTNELVCTSKKMDLKEGGINGTGDQDDGTSNPRSTKQISPRKRSSKGDRHSKISTAHGLRDRRVRLSLDVARQFFQLQDTLSYDKPSKTINWLLQQAESAIEDLKDSKESPINGAKSTAPSTSEGEVVESTIDEEFAHATPNHTASKQVIKSALRPAVTKELRKKARDRARERTLRKNQVSLLSNQERYLEEALDLHRRDGRAEGPLELGEESGSQIQNRQTQYERNSFGAAENFKGVFLAPGANWSPMTSLTYDQEYETCQINPIPEFQFHGSPTLECYGHPHVSQYYWTSWQQHV